MFEVHLIIFIRIVVGKTLLPLKTIQEYPSGIFGIVSSSVLVINCASLVILGNFCLRSRYPCSSQ